MGFSKKMVVEYTRSFLFFFRKKEMTILSFRIEDGYKNDEIVLRISENTGHKKIQVINYATT